MSSTHDLSKAGFAASGFSDSESEEPSPPSSLVSVDACPPGASVEHASSSTGRPRSLQSMPITIPPSSQPARASLSLRRGGLQGLSSLIKPRLSRCRSLDDLQGERAPLLAAHFADEEDCDTGGMGGLGPRRVSDPDLVEEAAAKNYKPKECVEGYLQVAQGLVPVNNPFFVDTVVPEEISPEEARAAAAAAAAVAAVAADLPEDLLLTDPTVDPQPSLYSVSTIHITVIVCVIWIFIVWLIVFLMQKFSRTHQ